MTLPASSLDAVLLTQSNCSLCDQAKALLDRLAADYPLAVTVLDFASPAGRALIERHGLPFSPALVLAGEPFGYGRIAERALRREIERHLTGGQVRPSPADSAPPALGAWRRRGRAAIRWLARSW